MRMMNLGIGKTGSGQPTGGGTCTPTRPWVRISFVQAIGGQDSCAQRNGNRCAACGVYCCRRCS
eukprot:13544846-Heterocapsa_arctica.AAC.1